MKKFFYKAFLVVFYPILKSIRVKQHKLKENTDKRYEGLWMGPPPCIVQLRELNIGDVFFCGGTLEDKVSDVIQNVSGGTYTHCGVYLGEDKVVDVVSEGIRKIDLHDFLGRYEYIAVTRSPGLDPSLGQLTNLRIKKLINFVRKCIESDVKYNWRGAVFSPMREYKNIENSCRIGSRDTKEVSHKFRGKYFCSEFILACFKATGWMDQNSSYFDGKNWTPTGLSDENIFQFVGYMSNKGLDGVSRSDPFIANNPWVLTESGQEYLKRRQRDFEKRIEALKKKDNCTDYQAKNSDD